MAYSATKDQYGNYVISQDGNRIATGAESILGNYGLSPTQLTSAPMPTSSPIQSAPTAIGTSTSFPSYSAPPASTPTSPGVDTTSLYAPAKPYENPTTIGQQNLEKYKAAHFGSASGASVNPDGSITISPYMGSSLYEYLASSGIDPNDWKKRQEIATKYGIANYSGSGPQNTQLLAALRAEKLGASVQQSGAIGSSVASGNTSKTTGLPLDLSKILGTGGVPSGVGAINVADLAGTGLDLEKILSASSTRYGSGISSYLSGLGEANKSYADLAKTKSETESKLLADMALLGNEGSDTAAALASAGVPSMQAQLQEATAKAARLQGELSAFDAETLQGLSNIEGQQIPLGLVQGQQAAFQKQRDLTRAAKAAELSATSGLIAAYSQNISTATEMVKQAMDLKYAPIENEINILKTQLQIATSNLSEAEKKKLGIVSGLLDIQESYISAKKSDELELQKMGINAASGGAPIATVQTAIASGDPVKAASMLSQWLKGPTESVSRAGGGSTTTDKTSALDEARIILNTGTSPGGTPYGNPAGADGYVDPAVYLKLYDRWVQTYGAGSGAEFLKKFPVSSYINPRSAESSLGKTAELFSARGIPWSSAESSVRASFDSIGN